MSRDAEPLICTEVVMCGWRGNYGDVEFVGDDCPDCDSGIVSTVEECPPACPECGEVAEIVSDGCAHECLFCGFVWGHESRRPDPNDPNDKQWSVETL